MALKALHYNKITETNDNGDPFSRKPSLKSNKDCSSSIMNESGVVKSN